MTGYTSGYVPPKGNAGGAAHGQFSTKKNPRSVPEKGSQIGSGSSYGTNADREKVMSLKKEQARKENLRGYAC